MILNSTTHGEIEKAERGNWKSIEKAVIIATSSLSGKEDEARRTLIKLGRADETENVLATKVNEEKKSNTKEWKEIFTVKPNRRALIITLTLGILQQMSGVVVITFYATTIFDLAGSSISPHIATIVIGVTQLGSSCITPFFVEWSGRKTLLMVSTGLCSISLVS